MKKHCLATACFLGLVSINIVMPFIECAEHNNCHIHSDEPAFRIFSVSNFGTAASGTFLSNASGTVIR